MAIDTSLKRMTALLDAVLLPDGDINAFDRASMLEQYDLSVTGRDSYVATLHIGRGKETIIGVFRLANVVLQLS
jgi:hypothetical protein